MSTLTRRLLGITVVSLLAAAACGSDDPSSDPAARKLVNSRLMISPHINCVTQRTVRTVGADANLSRMPTGH